MLENLKESYTEEKSVSDEMKPAISDDPQTREPEIADVAGTATDVNEKLLEPEKTESGNGNAKSPASKNINDAVIDKGNLSNTPFIPDEVYSNLPALLIDATKVISDAREKDLVLTSAIAIIGGCLYNVHGYYDGDSVYPNLFFFGIAPPASGKSRMKFARKLAAGVDFKILEDSKERVRKYLESKAADKEGIKGALLVEPTVKSLFIAGNTSSAAIITSLHENGGIGVLCETEADTLTYSLKQDWGGFSDLVRKGLHSEPYYYTRKGNQGKKNAIQIRIEEPKLAMALTGTPSQLIPLIHSQDDGLFSRFIYYAYAKVVIYRPVKQTKSGIIFKDYYEKLSEKVTDLFEKIIITGSITFSISEKQEDELNTFLNFHHGRLTSFLSNDAQSFINRMGTIGYKIAMILTVIRSFEAGTLNPKITCTDQDFQIVLSLMKVYLSHTETVYLMLPKKSNNETQKANFRIYQGLASKFRRQDLLFYLNTWGISERTLDYYLKEWVSKGLLIKDKNGVYRKPL